MAHSLKCSKACGIFPDQGWNVCLLNGQVNSLPLSHQGRLHDLMFENSSRTRKELGACRAPKPSSAIARPPRSGQTGLVSLSRSLLTFIQTSGPRNEEFFSLKENAREVCLISVSALPQGMLGVHLCLLPLCSHNALTPLWTNLGFSEQCWGRRADTPSPQF